MGNMMRGKRRMLKRERATNALLAVSLSSGLLALEAAYTPNVTKATYVSAETKKKRKEL